MNRYYRGITCAPVPAGAGLAQGGIISYKTGFLQSRFIHRMHSRETAVSEGKIRLPEEI